MSEENGKYGKYKARTGITRNTMTDNLQMLNLPAKNMSVTVPTSVREFLHFLQVIEHNPFLSGLAIGQLMLVLMKSFFPEEYKIFLEVLSLPEDEQDEALEKLRNENLAKHKKKIIYDD